MQQASTLSDATLNDIQNCLASLSPFSVIIFDPDEMKSYTPVSCAGVLNHLLQEKVDDNACKSTFEKVLRRAISSEETSFSICRHNLHYFIIPIPITREKILTIVAGKTASTGENASDHRGTASKLQSAGRILLENIFSQSKAETLSPKAATPKNGSDGIDKDQATIEQNMSMLLDALATLYHFKSVVVFYQYQKGVPHHVITAFGEKKERLKQLKAQIDFLMRPHMQERPYVFIDTEYDLRESGLPEDISSCALFSIYEGEGTNMSLAILNAPLSEDDAEAILSLCRKAGTVHENIKLKRQLSGYKKTIKSFSNLKKIIESPKRFELVHENFLEVAVQTLHAERGSLMLLDDDKQELSIKAIKGCDMSLPDLQGIKPGEGIAGRVFEEGRGILVDDRDHYHRLKQKPKPAYRTPSFISAPIKLKDRTIGLINLADKQAGLPFSKEDLAVLEAIGGYVAIALERSNLYERTKKLRQISITDPLTGLLNRRTFHERLLEEIERTRRHQVPVSLIILDLDDFKIINDTYGHQEGDELLKILSNAIRQYIRSIDVPSRYGGEEFTVILPQTRKEDAWIIADRLCKGIKQRGIRLKESSGVGCLAVSVGLATYPDDADSLEQLVRNADRALYQAKLQGKNRAVAFDKRTFT